MFVEYFDDGEASEPWTIAAFDPVNAPYYEYVETVGATLKKSEEFSWQVSSQIDSCPMFGNLKGET